MPRATRMFALSAPKTSSSPSEWGARAARLYSGEYAQRYRAVDDDIRHGALVRRFGEWLRSVCERAGREITALDLGCGTGRYFWALTGVRELVGVDVSPAMLAEARTPVDAGQVEVGNVTLVEGDFLTVDLGAGRFDLVYSIGVLGEHTPFDTRIAERVHRWLTPGGRFAFTAIDRTSFSVPRTAQRRVGEWLLPVTTGALKRRVRDRLLAGGLYVDADYLDAVLTASGFDIESLTVHESDVHRHFLCVARRRA